MNKRKVLFALYAVMFILTIQFSYGQDFTYTDQPVNLVYSYKKSLVLPDNKLLVIYGRNGIVPNDSHCHFYIHDKSGALVTDRLLLLQKDGFELYIKDAFIFNQNVYLLCFNVIPKTSEFNYVILKLNTQNLSYEEEKGLQFNNLPNEWLTSDEYRLCYSPDSSLIGIFTVSTMQRDFTRKVFVNVISADKLGMLNMKYVSFLRVGDNANITQLKDVALLNSGKIILLTKYYSFPGAEVYEGIASYHYLLQRYVLGKLQKSLSVTPDSNLMRDAVICATKTGEKILVAAYETDMDLERPKGIVLYEADSGLQKINRTSYIPWPDDMDTTLKLNGSYKIFIDNQPPYFIFLDNQRLYEVAGAKISHTSNTFRGKIVGVETDTLLNKKKLFVIDKYQFLADIIEKPFILDRANGIVYYIQNANHKIPESLGIYNTTTSTSTLVKMNSEHWNKGDYYDLKVDNNNLIIVQPKGKKYTLADYSLGK